MTTLHPPKTEAEDREQLAMFQRIRDLSKPLLDQITQTVKANDLPPIEQVTLMCVLLANYMYRFVPPEGYAPVERMMQQKVNQILGFLNMPKEEFDAIYDRVEAKAKAYGLEPNSPTSTEMQ